MPDPEHDQRVSLRDAREEDVPIFFEQQNDAESNRMAAFPARDAEAHAAHWRKILPDPSSVTKAILLGDRVVGHALSWDTGAHREIGYWVDRSHWGRGIATAALAQLLEVVRERPLHAAAAAHNLGSLRVLEKCGFRRTATETGADGTEMVLLELPG